MPSDLATDQWRGSHICVHGYPAAATMLKIALDKIEQDYGDQQAVAFLRGAIGALLGRLHCEQSVYMTVAKEYPRDPEGSD